MRVICRLLSASLSAGQVRTRTTAAIKITTTNSVEVKAAEEFCERRGLNVEDVIQRPTSVSPKSLGIHNCVGSAEPTVGRVGGCKNISLCSTCAAIGAG